MATGCAEGETPAEPAEELQTGIVTTYNSATFMCRGTTKGSLKFTLRRGKKCCCTFLLESFRVWQNADHDAAGTTTHWPFVALQNTFKHKSILEKKEGAEKQFLCPPPHL